MQSSRPAGVSLIGQGTSGSVRHLTQRDQPWNSQAGAGYSAVVGLFPRYSWPATIAVAIPAAAGVLVAWRVSAGSDSEPGRLSRAGLAAWALVWAGASVWELAALYLQPNLGTDSYAHPTLTYLADPILATVPGRSAV